MTMHRSTQLASISTFLLAAACGSADDTTTDDTDGVNDPNGPNEPVSEYGPGIADPCVAMPDSEFPNDEICLEPPPAELGVQVYYGPGGPGVTVDYDDPDVVAPFYIEPGDSGADVVQCQYRTLANSELKFTSEYHTRARGGTHHVIFWTAQGEREPLFPDGELTPECRSSIFEGYGFVPGTQSGFGAEGGRLDVPLDGIEVPENVGHARQLVPHANVAIETHYLNLTDKPILAEVWANFIFQDPDTVTNIVHPMFLIGGLDTNVPFGQEQLVSRDGQAPPLGASPAARLMGFAAHAHAHTTRVTAWINRAGGEKEYVYETYDWSEPVYAMFDSAHDYNPVNPGSGQEAAHTGLLTMGPGDTFGWECHIVNDDLPDVTLIFGDGAYEKEMCNMFGFYTGGEGQWNALGF
jgi:hypothetical protein